MYIYNSSSSSSSSSSMACQTSKQHRWACTTRRPCKACLIISSLPTWGCRMGCRMHRRCKMQRNTSKTWVDRLVLLLVRLEEEVDWISTVCRTSWQPLRLCWGRGNRSRCTNRATTSSNKATIKDLLHSSSRPSSTHHSSSLHTSISRCRRICRHLCRKLCLLLIPMVVCPVSCHPCVPVCMCACPLCPCDFSR